MSLKLPDKGSFDSLLFNTYFPRPVQDVLVQTYLKAHASIVKLLKCNPPPPIYLQSSGASKTQDVYHVGPHAERPRAGIRSAEIPPSALATRRLAETSPANHHSSNNDRFIPLRLTLSLRSTTFYLPLINPIKLPPLLSRLTRQLPHTKSAPLLQSKQPTPPPRLQRRPSTFQITHRDATELAADGF